MSPATTGRRSPEESTALILDAAQQLLWEVSLGELTVGTLMAATPLGRSSFYVYFDDIDDLVARLLGRLEHALWEPARAWIEGTADRAGLAAALDGVVDVWAAHGPVLSAIVQASWHDEAVHALWRDGLMGRFIDGVAAGIRREIDAGHITDRLEPVETASALLMMNERYLMDRLGRLPQHDRTPVATTLQQIWTRSLYGS
jgi:AcrR family transcriptional regulator